MVRTKTLLGGKYYGNFDNFIDLLAWSDPADRLLHRRHRVRLQRAEEHYCQTIRQRQQLERFGKAKRDGPTRVYSFYFF